MKTLVLVVSVLASSTAFAASPCDGHADRATYDVAKTSIEQVLDSSERLRGHVMSVHVGTCHEGWMAEALEMNTDEVPSAEYCGVRIELDLPMAVAGFAASALLTGPEMPWGAEGEEAPSSTVPFCVVHREHNRSH